MQNNSPAPIISGQAGQVEFMENNRYFKQLVPPASMVYIFDNSNAFIPDLPECVAVQTGKNSLELLEKAGADLLPPAVETRNSILL